MTGRTWTLQLGAGPPLTHNGSRGHPIARSRAVKVWRRLAWARALEQEIPLLRRASIELHYAPRDRRRRDPMNLTATLKPVEDGIVDAGVLPDDTPEHSVPTVPVIDAPTGRPGRLYVVVRELTVQPSAVEWFRRTGHCGLCGQPGGYCTCTPAAPCPCRELHPMGSGLVDGAAAAFADASVKGEDGLW